jgi:hypothetical protein
MSTIHGLTGTGHRLAAEMQKGTKESSGKYSEWRR